MWVEAFAVRGVVLLSFAMGEGGRSSVGFSGPSRPVGNASRSSTLSTLEKGRRLAIAHVRTLSMCVRLRVSEGVKERAGG